MPEPRREAAFYALVAAFVWAAYYAFVLDLRSSVSSLALIVYPFLFGGLAYAVWVAAHGEGRHLLALFASPGQWGRVLMFLALQLGILYITLESGAVDAALLSLVGDVAVTPLVVMWVFGEGRDRLRSAAFLLGIALSAVGAVLTILASGTLEGFTGLSLLVAPVVPFLVAGYFVSAARAGRTFPAEAIVGQSAIGAGLLGLPLTFLLPAGTGTLLVTGGVPWSLLLGVGVTSFFVAPLLYFRAIGRAGIFLPSLLMAAIPVFTLGFAALVSGALPPLLGLVGVPIAVAGGILAVRGSVGSPGPDPAP